MSIASWSSATSCDMPRATGWRGRAPPGTPFAAQTRWKAFETMPKIARVSDYAEERARENKRGSGLARDLRKAADRISRFRGSQTTGRLLEFSAAAETGGSGNGTTSSFAMPTSSVIPSPISERSKRKTATKLGWRGASTATFRSASRSCRNGRDTQNRPISRARCSNSTAVRQGQAAVDR